MIIIPRPVVLLVLLILLSALYGVILTASRGQWFWTTIFATLSALLVFFIVRVVRRRPRHE